MENVTLDIVYSEIKKLEMAVKQVDEKVENFMGFFELDNKEKAELLRIKTDSKTISISLNKLADELKVGL